jgi:hypothetical protein
MTKKSGIRKSREQELSKVINQMDGWVQDKTRLILSVSTPLFHLFLRGRVVGRQQGLFLFDSYGETYRVPVIPEHYDHIVCGQKSPVSVTFETSAMQGQLKTYEDGAKPMFEEICANWVLSSMAADTASSNIADQQDR